MAHQCTDHSPLTQRASAGAPEQGEGAVTCPRPSYYFNTLCLPLRSFYLSDFSRTHHLGPSRGQTASTPRREQRGREGFCLIYWKRLGAAEWPGWTHVQEGGGEVGAGVAVSDEPD